jgi:hypothetical protein
MGFPGDVEAFIRPYVVSGQKISKEKGGMNFLPKISEKRIFPTSQELRELSKEAHQGKLEPEGDVERIGGQVLQDYIFSPGGPVKKIILSSLGSSVQEGLKFSGAAEDTQSKAKAATTFLGSFVGKSNVKDFYRKEYSKATRSLPVKETLDSVRLSKGLTALENRVKQGVDIPAKEPGLRIIKELKDKSSSGQIPIRDLDSAYHNINQFLLDKKNLSPTAEKWLKDTKRMVSHELNRYGKKNPEYLKSFRDANAAFAGLAENQKAVQALSKWKKSGLLAGPPAIVAELYFMGPEITAATVATAAGAYGAASGYDLMTRVFSNKTLFHYYTKALGAAAQENLPQFTHNISKLDKKLREENLETSRFVDTVRREKLIQRQ